MAPRNCGHLLDELSDYVEGEASDERCTEIERHLADCGDCRVVVDTLRQTIRLYRSLPEPSLPADARERLYRSLDLGPYLGPA